MIQLYDGEMDDINADVHVYEVTGLALIQRMYGRLINRKSTMEPGRVYLNAYANQAERKNIIAVTMRGSRNRSSLSIVEQCLERLMNLAYEHRFKRVALPPLGLTGGVERKDLSRLFYDRLEGEKTDYIVVSKDKKFNHYVEIRAHVKHVLKPILLSNARKNL